jgi:hypothetical protein
MTKCLLALALALLVTPAFAQGVFIQQPEPVKISPDEGTLAFERPKLEFAPQSVGIENCENVSLTNTTDHPRLLTQLRSLDSRHFKISSPNQEMLPITVGGNTSFYINICFKAEETKPYSSTVLAIFQTDTVRLTVSGKGLTPPDVIKLLDEAAITEATFKKKVWTFRYGLKNRAYAKLTLENINGQTVKSFPSEELKTAGYYEFKFDGVGDRGKKLDKGMYILRLEAVDPTTGKKTHSSKVITIK